MKQEDKDLLLKDLCSRLPHGVKGVLCDDCTCTLDRIWTKKGYESVIIAGDYYDIEDFKPYLFPLSSMTEEQKQEYQYITERWMYDSSYSIGDSIDWLNANHFDQEVVQLKKVKFIMTSKDWS